MLFNLASNTPERAAVPRQEREVAILERPGLLVRSPSSRTIVPCVEVRVVRSRGAKSRRGNCGGVGEEEGVRFAESSSLWPFTVTSSSVLSGPSIFPKKLAVHLPVDLGDKDGTPV